MIVQEFSDKYVMIAQHDHAAISGTMAKMWKHTHFPDKDKRPSVEDAIKNHDIGWKLIDEAPIWNDVAVAPYTFTTYPTALKTVLYRYGIDEVAQADNYAALLCSKHYDRFLKNNSSEAAGKFVQEEKARRKQLIQSINNFGIDHYHFHYGILQMLDDMSLFLCLNEPGVQKENEHPFFKNGINKHEGITTIQEDKVHLFWKDKHTVSLHPFVFAEPFTISLQQRNVMKQAIKQNGILKSYQNAPVVTHDITLIPN